jgi:hypothetical protein
MPKRIALIVSHSAGPTNPVAQLKSPLADIQALAAVLREPSIGNFNQVKVLVDQPAVEVRQRLVELFQRKQRHDDLLLYWLGSGWLDEAGQLQLLTSVTTPGPLAHSAIPAAELTAHMDRSFSRHQLLILDCVYHRMPGRIDSGPSSGLGLAAIFKGRGFGRTVVTATNVIQGGAAPSDQVREASLIHHFIQGLRSGAADTDRDGQIDLAELFEYLQQQLKQVAGCPQPRRWVFGYPDKFIVARNPHYFTPARQIKWDLLFGAIMTPITIIAIGGGADLRTSVGLAGLFVLMYALLYWVLE